METINGQGEEGELPLARSLNPTILRDACVMAATMITSHY